MRRSLALALALAGSVSSGAVAQNRPPQGSNPTQATLNRAADAILALKSTRFALKREGTPAFLDEKNGVTFTAADCVYVAPDRVSCNVKVSLRNGTIVQLTRVWVPEGTFQSNPLTRQFAKVPGDANFNGVVLFARTGIPQILRTAVQNPQTVGPGTVLGRSALHLKGQVAGQALNPLMGGTLRNDALYPVDLWVEERTAQPAQLHVAEPDGSGWLIELSGLNEPATPRVPPARPQA